MTSTEYSSELVDICRLDDVEVVDGGAAEEVVPEELEGVSGALEVVEAVVVGAVATFPAATEGVVVAKVVALPTTATVVV